MRNIYYLFLLIFAISCSSNESDPSPGLEASTKQQAPFGSDTVAIKLKSVSADNQVVGEYFYANGYLAEHRQYLKNFNSKAHYATGLFKRTDGFPATYEKLMADYDVDRQYVSNSFLSAVFYRFDPPKTNAARDVNEVQTMSGNTYSRRFLFDRLGFVIQQEVTQKNDESNKYITTYIRDANSNVSSCWDTKVSDSKKTNRRAYEYDNHPNPFNKIGVDWKGDISIHTFGTNNITKETVFNENGGSSITTFEYKYASGGYPESVTIVTDNPASSTAFKFAYY